MKIMIINGPNLNMLGKREPELYGESTLLDIINYTHKKVEKLSSLISLEWYQSNSEGEIIEKIHLFHLDDHYQGLIINPAAYSHTSVAILDSLRLLKKPVVEVHLTNIYKREEYRHTLLTAKASEIIMLGLGKDSYYQAVYSLYQKEENSNVSNN